MGKGPSFPDPFQTAQAQGNQNYQTAQQNFGFQNANVYTPYGQSTFSQEGWQPIYSNTGQVTGYAPRYSQHVELSPGEEKLRLQNEQLRGSLATTANQQAGRIGKLLSTNMNTTGLSPWQQYGKADTVRRDEGPTDRAAIERAMMQRYDESTDPRVRAAEAQAAARGMAPGGQGYGQMEKQISDARAAAGREAYLASGEESRAAQDAYNRAVQAKYTMGSDWADRMNTLRQNEFVERTSLRDQPIKEISTLLGLTGPNTPTFTPFQGSSMSPVNIAQMIYDKSNAENAAKSANLSGMFNMGATALSMLPFSDRRVKENIRRLKGTLAGLPLYSFRFKKCHVVPQKLWGEYRVGVMSDEVRELHPDAVHRLADGFDRVDYELLNARQANG
jgi:hypothetical protein